MTRVKRILFADDDQDDVDMFSEALTSVEPSVFCEFAKHGKDALNILTTPSNPKPDVIFLDLNMPVMDGWECLQILKKNALLKNIPVVIYSTSTYEVDKEKAFRLGAFCFISKPHRFTILKGLVSVLLKTPIDNWSSACNAFRNITFNDSKLSKHALDNR
jgi:CheY-like chemotaxis protein